MAFTASVAIVAFGAGERLRSHPVELVGLNPRQATILAIARTLTGDHVPQIASLRAADALASIESLCGVHPSQGSGSMTEQQAAYDRYRKRTSQKSVPSHDLAPSPSPASLLWPQECDLCLLCCVACSWWATIHAFMNEDEVKEAVMTDPQHAHVLIYVAPGWCHYSQMQVQELQVRTPKRMHVSQLAHASAS